MSEPSLLLQALRAFACGDALPAGADRDPVEIEKAVASGLGPILFHLLPGGDIARGPGYRRLQSASLTSRALSAELLGNVHYALAALAQRGITATVLKGISYATRYYPAPHLRVMRDVDLLVPEERLDAAVAALGTAGFVAAPASAGIDWSRHIHVPGMHHPQRGVWIELHRRLVPDSFAACREPPLNLADLESYLTEDRLGASRVQRLSPEFELVYLAVSWCRDLTAGCGDRGVRRMPFDAVALLTRAPELDWERVLDWSRGSMVGTCVHILLSYLVSRGIVHDRHALARRLAACQPFVNPASLHLIHRLLDVYVVGTREFGPVDSPGNVTSLFASLIAPHGAWRNLLTIPANLVFPRTEPRRFSLRFQLGRVRSMFRSS